MEKTAKELLNELSQDTAYQERQKQQAKDIEKLKEICANDEVELVAELQQKGVEVTSVWDLVNLDEAPPPSISCPIQPPLDRTSSTNFIRDC
jgi:hypothetical protein